MHPVAQIARRVPFHLEQALKKWLEKGVKEDILEPVPENAPNKWCSPLVVQTKPRFESTPKSKLEPYMIRASIYLRVPNKYMERNRISVATVVDMVQGYHQLMLDPASREIATFATPWGNMRPKRLMFGAKSSQDIIDEAIYKVFCDIPNCLNQRDDIL